MDPAVELLQKVVAAMKADAGVAAFVGAKVYDRPPHKNSVPDVPSPYISLGPHDTITDELADCLDNVTVTFQIDVWSWGENLAYSRTEAGNIASAVRKALHRKPVELTSGRNAELVHQGTRFLRDPDGTNHAAITFECMIDVTI